MRKDIDKILELLKEKTINAAEAERLIKTLHKVQVCEDVKEKVQCVVDASSKLIVKTVDFAVMGVEKINPYVKDMYKKAKRTIGKGKYFKHKMDIEVEL